MPTAFPSAVTCAPGGIAAGSRRPRKQPVRAPAVVHPGDRLLSDVTALRKADGTCDDAGLAGKVLGTHVLAEARNPVLDPEHLCSLLADGSCTRVDQRGAQAVGLVGRREDVDPARGAAPSRPPPPGWRPRPEPLPRREKILRSVVRSEISTWRPIL